MLDSQLAIQEHALAIASATGVAPGPTGARHPTITPFATFRAADGFVVIAAGNDAMFGKLCAVLGLDIAADPALPRNAARCENHALLKRLIETVTLGQSRSRIGSAVLEAAGLPTARVQDMVEVLADPQMRRAEHGAAGDAASRRAGLHRAGQPDQDVHPAGSGQPAPCPTVGRRPGGDPGLAGSGGLIPTH
jgi:crotonobetainyl-CoA:carnitine CoA-transferase CaiB-like acyl-CoA transferase